MYDRVRLWAHCVSKHSVILSPDLNHVDLLDYHRHEHEGPGTIRDHDSGDISYSLKGIGKVLSECEEQLSVGMDPQVEKLPTLNGRPAPQRDRYLCLDCKGTSDPFMVYNEVWAKAGYKPKDVCCLDCLEKRLGRPITVEDLTPASINNTFRYAYRQGLSKGCFGV